MKKQLISTIVIAASLVCANAYAAKDTAKSVDAAPAVKVKTKQQTKMADCNKGAKEKSLKGADRKTFMSSCLSAKAA